MMEAHGSNFVVAPGEFLQEWIDEEGNGITPSDIAGCLGVSCDFVERFLSGKAPVSPELALRLEHITGILRKAWLVYDKLYQEERDRHGD